MTTVNQYRVWCTDPTAHYEFTWGTVAPTVCPSDGSPIDTNLTTVVQSVSNADVDVVNLPRGTFGELAVEEITPIIQLYFTYNNIAQLIDTIVVGSGTVTNANGMAVVSSGAAINSSASLESIKPAKYRTGEGMLFRFTGIFTSGVVGNTQMIGGFDSENGIGFGYDGTDFGIFRRSNSVTTWAAQTSWNIDQLDGSGPSGLTIDFGDGFGNVFQVQYQYLGFGAQIFFVENPSTGKFTEVHIIRYSNTAVVPSFDNASFPLAIESNNTTNNTDIVIKTASMIAAVEGKVVFTGPRFIDTWNNVTVLNGTETFIDALNIKTTFIGKTNKTIVLFVFLSFATGATDRSQILRLRKNATFTAPVWTDINATESSVQTLTGGTWNAGTGTVVLQQNVAGTGIPTTITIEPTSSSLSGVPGDNLVITLEGLGAGSNWGSIEWLEDQ